MSRRHRSNGRSAPRSNHKQQKRSALSEPLEARRMLSISSATLAGPFDEVGTHWEYTAVDGAGDTSTYIETAAGPTTYNGFDCQQVNVGPTGASHIYEGFDSAGNYVQYGGFIQYPSGTTQSDTFSPVPSTPAQLEAGVTYSTTYTDTEVTFNSPTTTTNVTTDTDTVMLVSDTTSSITVPLGTYDAYEVRTSSTTVTPNGDGTTSSDTTTDDEWIVPGIGNVKSTEYNNDGSLQATFNLSVFGPAPDHLAFVQAPGNGAATVPLKPVVSVAVDGADGNPKTDDNGTVITLAAIGFNEGATITGNTASTVNGVATFPNLTFPKKGVYQIKATDAANDPEADTSKFVITGNTLTLTINSRSAHKADPGVATGDIIFYDLNVTSKNPIQSTNFTETLPAGFSPDKITDGGTFSGNTITWNTSDHDVSFQVTVPDADKLAGLKAVTTTAHATSTYTDTTTDDADATDTVKLAGSLKITGTLHDAQYQYPAKLSIATPALGGVTANLIDSDGDVIDSVKTAKNGTFKLTAKDPGTYTVEFDAVVTTYSSASNGLSSSHAYAGKSVTIPNGNTKPIDLKDLYLPATFFATAAKTLNSLNNYRTSGFQGLASFALDLMKFDTSAPEGVVTGLLGTQSSPSPLLNPTSLKIGGPTDPWVTGMRAIAAAATIDSRFSDTFRLADQLGKIVAVAASIATVKGIGKLQSTLTSKFPSLTASSSALGPGIRLPFVSFTGAKLTQAARIGVFTALGDILGPLLDTAGVSGTNKNYVFAAVFGGLRYATDLFTGKFVDDLGFETVFNVARLGIDAGVLYVLTGATLRFDLPAPYSILAASQAAFANGTLNSFQNALTTTGVLSYSTNTDTSQVLSALDKFDGKEHNLVDKVQAATSIVNAFAGAIKSTDGATNVLNAAGTFSPTTKLGELQKRLFSQASG